MLHTLTLETTGQKTYSKGFSMTEKPQRYETQAIEQMIMTIRGQKVILDADLARIYAVPTKRLNEQVRRNADRFPLDFAFVLTDQEVSKASNPNLRLHPTVEGATGRMFSLNMGSLWRLTSFAAEEQFR